MSPSLPDRIYVPWQQLAQRAGAEFDPRGGDTGPAVRLTIGDATITLRCVHFGEDSYRQEIRAPFVNDRNLRFVLRRTPGWFRWLTWWRRDVRVGDATFDHTFQVDTRTPLPAQVLLSDEELRLAFLGAPRVRFELRHHGAFPDGVDELYAACAPMERLDEVWRLFRVFVVFLRHLERNPHFTDEVRNHVRRLEGPRGQVTMGVVLWEGDSARRHAAEALGRLGDERAVGPLLRAVDDPDPVVRVKAIRSLGVLGSERAAPVLVPLLRPSAEAIPGSVPEAAGWALQRLGQGDLVDAYHRTLDGDGAALRPHLAGYRGQVVTALLACFAGPGRVVVGRAMWGLAEIGAFEALPAMRKRAARVRIPALAEECKGAIAHLEGQASLPRSARPDATDARGLPRVVPADEVVDRRSLPRVPPGPDPAAPLPDLEEA